MDRQEITLEGVITEEAAALPAWKRGLDLGLILMAAPGLILIGAVVGLLIKAGSRGPMFFRQRRVGHKGREFVLYKFRTMAADAETDTHRLYAQKLMNDETPMTKLDAKKDPRVIPLGGLLRAEERSGGGKSHKSIIMVYLSGGLALPGSGLLISTVTKLARAQS
jgi:lipopolysaccharide/colanic/teichoic acid biosynthesis glycosyltransferase